MTFRNKILLSIWGVVLSLLVITFFIINYWSRSRIEETYAAELRTNFSTVVMHERLQSEQLIRACLVIAESPRLRAVAELRDPKTAFQLLQELYQTTLSQLFVLTDSEGKPLVQLVRGHKDQWDISNAESIQKALQYVASTDVWAVHDTTYRVVSVPIYIDTDLVGTLTIGFSVPLSDILTLKRATNSDIILVYNHRTFMSTLDSMEARSVLPALVPLHVPTAAASRDTVGAVFNLTAQDEAYLGTAFRLNRPMKPDTSEIFYLIVKPLSREVRQAMGSILGTFGVVSLVFLALTTVIGLVISRSMTRPIRELVKGTTEVSRGNYDYAIRVRGRDELSFLGQKFTEMSSSLKEKITQLGQLNRDLFERNRDLDETLQQLRSAQEELVRSERLAATGKMTAQLAHEINNPIHNIQSCLKTALGRLPGEAKGRELIDVAYDEVNRLSRLILQMLDFYRNSLVEEEMKATNLNDVLREIIAITQSELANNNIVLNQTIEARLPLIRGSRDKLKQVLLNLVSNARDAMPNGGRLDICVSTHDGTIRIAVKDNGIGIPKENLSRIFDAFFTTKRKVSGVGLGLSVSYGIISQHRGTIEVRSTVGEGSTFTVILPYEE